ncbi:MAG: condensation domain-containing protein, partial [Chloroflexota bacterium]
LNNERKFMFTPMANIGVVARLHGSVDQDAVRRAIDKVRVVHPMAATRVVKDDDRDVWFHTDGVPEIPLRVVERQTDDQWFAEIRRERQIPFDPFTGPLLRFALLRSDEASDLLVYAQHAICDGTGLAYLMRDVLLHLGNPELEARPLPTPPSLTSDNLPDGVRENLLVKFARKLYSGRLNRRWRKNPLFFDIEDFRNIHDAFLQRYTLGVVTAELSAGETERLIGACREQKVSVNSGVTTAFIAAYDEIVGPLQGSKEKVAIPVDMRKRLGKPVGDVLDVYVGSVMFDFRYDSSKPFWENTRMFHRVAHQKIESLACFEVMYEMEDIDGSLMDVLLGFGTMSRLVPPGASRYEKLASFAQDRKNAANQLAARFSGALPGVVNTNLGNLNFPERYGEIDLERLYFVPSTGPDFPLVIGVATTSGRLTLTLNYLEEVSSTPTMTDVRDRALGYLGLAASRPSGALSGSPRS